MLKFSRKNKILAKFMTHNQVNFARIFIFQDFFFKYLCYFEQPKKKESESGDKSHEPYVARFSSHIIYSMRWDRGSIP